MEGSEFKEKNTYKKKGYILWIIGAPRIFLFLIFLVGGRESLPL